MKKTLSLLSLLFFFFLASCSKEKVEPKVESITATAALYEEVEILWPGTIPAGWVTVRANGSYRTIRNLNGAPYGAEVQALLPVTLPINWVAVSANGSYRTYRHIDLNGAPYGTRVEALLPATFPINWVPISRRTSANGHSYTTYKSLNGAPYGAEVRVVLPAVLPPGWVAVREDGSYRTYRNLNRG